MNERIGELLVKENLLTKEQLRDARSSAKGSGNRLGASICSEENSSSVIMLMPFMEFDIVSPR